MATNYVLQHSGKEIDNLLAKVQNLPEDISTLKFEIVEKLPVTDINSSTIYLIKTKNNDYEEYIYINNQWEMLGSTKLDLTDYATKTYVNEQIDAIPDVDFTGYATEDYVQKEISDIEIPSIEGLATETYVNTEVAKVTKASLGLNNVENKSSEAIRNEITKSNITTALGYTPAELDGNGKVPTSQLPSYVDDVLEYSAKANFPSTGETGKIYVDTTTNLTYRWSGSAYVEISPSLALGETSSTAYRGDRGKEAYDHSQVKDGSNPHAITFSNIAAKPTTLSGYSITDAKIANGLITLGANSITPLTANSTLDATKLTGLASIDTTGKASNAGTADSLKGVTATATELNYIKGVTSSVQVQLNNLANNVSSGSIPKGLICMWSGSTVPTGWALCNGANGTPDLRDKFIVGSGNLYSIGKTGGSATVALTEAQMPSHTHAISGETGSAGNHIHNYSYSYTSTLTQRGTSTEGYMASSKSLTSNKTTNNGAHTHTLNVTINNTGSGSPHENLPPYYALAFIMKL